MAGTWRSSNQFDAERIGAVAIYCSDGRFNEQFDEFLHESLELPCYDRLTVPGGPAALAGHISAHRTEDALAESLTFLVHHHRLERVVLIAHKECGFYLKKLMFGANDLRRRQEEDLAKAAARVRSMAILHVDAYFASVGDGRVLIEPVEV